MIRNAAAVSMHALGVIVLAIESLKEIVLVGHLNA